MPIISVRGIRPAGASASSNGTVHRASRMPSAAPDQGEQRALGQQLAHQSRPAGSERRAYGDLALSSGGARQKKVRDIRAGDEQDEQHRAREHLKRPPDVADQQLLERQDSDVPLGTVLRGRPVRKRVE